MAFYMGLHFLLQQSSQSWDPSLPLQTRTPGAIWSALLLPHTWLSSQSKSGQQTQMGQTSSSGKTPSAPWSTVSKSTSSFLSPSRGCSHATLQHRHHAESASCRPPTTSLHSSFPSPAIITWNWSFSSSIASSSPTTIELDSIILPSKNKWNATALWNPWVGHDRELPLVAAKAFSHT